jgi:hypothetical protein
MKPLPEDQHALLMRAAHLLVRPDTSAPELRAGAQAVAIMVGSWKRHEVDRKVRAIAVNLATALAKRAAYPHRDGFVRALSYAAAASAASIMISSLRLAHQEAQRVDGPPGARFLQVARRIFSTRLVERVFDQVVADMRHEYIQALAAGDTRGAALAKFWGYVALARTLVALVPLQLFKRVVELWKAI